jgi:hypothetical protein
MVMTISKFFGVWRGWCSLISNVLGIIPYSFRVRFIEDWSLNCGNLCSLLLLLLVKLLLLMSSLHFGLCRGLEGLFIVGNIESFKWIGHGFLIYQKI